MGLSPEEEEDILSQITPQSFDLSGIFLGPVKSSLKIMLSRGCYITSLQEMDLDLATRDVTLVSDVKSMIKEIIKLKLSPWQRCLIPEQNTLTTILMACDGLTMAASASVYFISTPVLPGPRAVSYTHLTLPTIVCV